MCGHYTDPKLVIVRDFVERCIVRDSFLKELIEVTFVTFVYL